ncbi:MAG: dinitrogenase iron-molybdenum cofactor biosynthesis protein [Candidatus Thorarchaeota archaeon]|nr:dinitrogenase iron-molybdenum cofactor biosynthesis protein [Candidatus Thorarchaeota archaeon]
MTKVAVSSTGSSLNSPIDPRFGRCTYFIVADTDTMEFKAIPNPAVNAAGGAGVQAAQTVIAEGAEAVITGTVGPHAMTALHAANKQILSCPAGTVMQAIESYKRSELKTLTTSAPAYTGAGMGGRGRMGHGHGRGRGGW